MLGANDGILSVAGLVIGVAAANSSQSALVTAGLAGLVAGALSMAVGEYISVSSQRDAEQADLRVEADAIAENRRAELRELAKIYEDRGVEPGLARLVADQLMAHDAVGAHARDELGISEVMTARPLQAALTSAAAFTVGALVPVLAVTLSGKAVRIGVTAVLTIVALIGLGALGAQLGGAPRGRAAIRVVTLSTLSMLLTYGIGRLVGANV
ncbi:MAG: vacuolar iron transporter family protein [Actinomycetota bacterium]|nr:vacuolar iron transporter family protein [Actinomycetota bacterium]